MKCFECSNADENIINALILSCGNLTVLELMSSFHIQVDKIDSLLTQLFINNQRIKTLKLRGFKNLTGESLLYLEKNTSKITKNEMFRHKIY